MRAKPVYKYLYLNHLKKADEFLQQSSKAIDDKRRNAAVSLAIHAGISAADALCISRLGVRSSGESHEEVIQLINKLDLENKKIKIRQLLNLLNFKNSAEYSENLMTEKDSLSAKQNAERFLSWVKNNLKS